MIVQQLTRYSWAQFVHSLNSTVEVLRLLVSSLPHHYCHCVEQMLQSELHFLLDPCSAGLLRPVIYRPTTIRRRLHICQSGHHQPSGDCGLRPHDHCHVRHRSMRMRSLRVRMLRSASGTCACAG